MIFIPIPSLSPALWPDLFVLISSLVASLAWPVTLAFLLLVFRKGVASILDSIKDRMPNMERLKTPLIEASWSTSAVEDLSKEVDNFGHTGLITTQTQDDIPTQVAKLKPAAGVIDAFLEVEQKVRRYLRTTEWNEFRKSAIWAFQRDSGAPNQLKSAVRELATLRNAAAHGVGDISLESALEYIRTASRVAREIDLLIDESLVGPS